MLSQSCPPMSSCPRFLCLLAFLPGLLTPSLMLPLLLSLSASCILLLALSIHIHLLILVSSPLPPILSLSTLVLSLPPSPFLFVCYWVSGLLVLAVSGCCFGFTSVGVLLCVCDSCGPLVEAPQLAYLDTDVERVILHWRAH